MLVKALDFADRSGVLKLSDSILFDGENDAVRTTDGDGGTAAVNSLKGVLDLEELTVWTEHGVCLIVSGHCEILFVLI